MSLVPRSSTPSPRRRDTRGTLRNPPTQPCCDSCAHGEPCAGSCAPKPATEGGACCSSCAHGGACDSDKLVPGVYAGSVGVAEGGKLWVTRHPARGVVVKTRSTMIGPDEVIVATVVDLDIFRAARRLGDRRRGVTGRVPRRGRDTRGLLRAPGPYQAAFWGPSDAEEQAFEKIRTRFMALPAGTVADMKAKSATMRGMIDAMYSWIELWLKGDEDPDQLSDRAKDLAIIENTARDEYGFNKPAGDVVVPLPQDNPVLDWIDDLGEALGDAGLPMPDPHSDKGLDLGPLVTLGKVVAVAAGVAYFAGPAIVRSVGQVVQNLNLSVRSAA